MNLPHPVQRFFDLPSDSDIDGYLQKDLRLVNGKRLAKALTHELDQHRSDGQLVQ
jgi:hypothetical protein